MGETLLTSGEILTIRDNSYSPSSFRNQELFPWPTFVDSIDVPASATTVHERNVLSDTAFYSGADTDVALDTNLNIIEWTRGSRDQPSQTPSTADVSEDTTSVQPSVRSGFERTLASNAFVADVEDIHPSRTETSPGLYQDLFLHVGESVDIASFPLTPNTLFGFLGHIPEAGIEGEGVPAFLSENSSFLKDDTPLFNTAENVLLSLPHAEPSLDFEIREFTPNTFENHMAFSNSAIPRRTRRKFRPIERSNNKTGRTGKMRCARCRRHKQKGGFILRELILV